MISESINTQRTLEKNLGQPCWPTPETENSDSDQSLHYLLKIPEKWE